MSIRDLLQSYGVPTADSSHHHVRHGWVGVDCPHCSPGWGKFRMGFELATGRCNCWVCGRCDAAQSLATLCRIPLADAIRVCRTRGTFAAAELPHTGVLKLPKSAPMTSRHRQYLINRGFEPDVVETLWGVTGIGMETPRLRWRLLIPIHDPFGRVVSWTTRAIAKTSGLRYISASPDEESLPHKSLIYGAHLARHAVVVTEGPIDAWAIGPGAVGVFGVGYSAEQVAALARFPIRAVCFDADDAGRRRADKLCHELAQMPGITENIILETGHDAATADYDELIAIRERFLE